MALEQVAGAQLCGPNASLLASAGVVASSSSRERVRALMVEHFDFVWRTLRRFGVPESSAEDHAQQVFMIAWNKIDRIELGAEKSFLFGTSRRVAADARASVAARREQPDSVDDAILDARRDSRPDPEELVGQRRARQVLDEILEQLEPNRRAVFVLFELEEMTGPEIASLLDLPLGTVTSRLHYAREDFRALAARRKAQTTQAAPATRRAGGSSR